MLVGGTLSGKHTLMRGSHSETFRVSRGTFTFILDRIRHVLERQNMVEEPTFRLPAQLTFVAIADAHPCAPSIDFLIVFEHSASVTHWCATSETLIFCNLFAT